MSDALRFEWTRLTTLRSTWWLTGIAALLGVAVSLLIAFAYRQSLSGRGPTAEDLRLLPPAIASQGASVFVPYLLGFVVAMIGVFAWGHEYRHGMVRATLTAVPVRTAVFAAKLLVVGVWVVVVSLVAGLVSLLVGALVLSGSGVDVVGGDSLRMVLRCAAYTLVLTWVVTAFTALVRAQVLTLVLMFLWPFLIENIVSTVVAVVPALEALRPAIRFLPFDAGQRMVREQDLGLSGDPLSPWAGFGVFGGLALVLVVVSFVLFQRRDA